MVPWWRRPLGFWKITAWLVTAMVTMAILPFEPTPKKTHGSVINTVLVRLLEVHAHLGSVRAQIALAEQYGNGHQIPHDDRRSIAWYRRAAANGHLGAQYYLGDRFFRSQDPAERAEGESWWIKAAEAGHQDAQTQLAHLYTEVRVRPAEAVKWWRQMAALDPRGCRDRSLAWALHRGWGVERNQQKALAIWRRLATQCAEHDAFEANYYLGEAAATGDGVPQDPAEAVRLWLIGSEGRTAHWEPRRAFALCRAYGNGVGIARDPVEAARWCYPIYGSLEVEMQMRPELETSASDPSTASPTVIGIVERRRAGTEAMTILRTLLPELRTRAMAGDPRAQYAYARALSDPRLLGCQPREAIDFYRRSAKQGYEAAVARIGYFDKGGLPCTPPLYGQSKEARRE